MQTALEERSTTPKGRRQRDRLVEAAEGLFASRGFHGASMRELAAGAGLPLATAVYHFARKEQLYAAVLSAIADQLTVEVLGAAAGDLDRFVRALVQWSLANPRRVELLLRELLDNPPRVAKAAKLPLAPFLIGATALVAEAQRAGLVEVASPELAVLHVVGGISYIVAAQPTVARIVGATRAKVLAQGAQREAIALASHSLGRTR
jgi:AcrR family transcriptional regulator